MTSPRCSRACVANEDPGRGCFPSRVLVRHCPGCMWCQYSTFAILAASAHRCSQCSQRSRCSQCSYLTLPLEGYTRCLRFLVLLSLERSDAAALLTGFFLGSLPTASASCLSVAIT